MKNLYDPTPVLEGLKDFQRDTVDYVFSRMYDEVNPTSRFLVADEVGLGKTLVARGVIARAVRHLEQEGVKRIDVVYVCSNVDIAEQNIRRLALPGFNSFTRATRLTMLPLQLHDLTQNHLNFVAFTPGTSFNLRSSMGRVEERALLHWLLVEIWGKRALTTSGAYRVLQGGVATVERFKGVIDRLRGKPLDKTLLNQFGDAIDAVDRRAHAKNALGLRDRFSDLSDRYRYEKRNRPAEDRHDQSLLIGELRQILAATCIDALEPDLVILDEFQRFRNLLDDDSEEAELAHGLFNFKDVRTLLLSATPYKMFSVSDDSEDDHYRDFMRTTAFLMNGNGDGFAEALDDLRTCLFNMSDSSHAETIKAKEAVEQRLRSVMVRTERGGVSEHHGEMLAERESPSMSLQTNDLQSFLATEHVSRTLGAGSSVEYWKSAPYLLNFMDGYKLAREFQNVDRRTTEWRQIQPVLESGVGLMNWADYDSYTPIQPGNARLRSLIAASVEPGMWKLLWLPPSLPYYELGEPFAGMAESDLTKRLVFSSWNIVPKVVASLTSYEAERRMMTVNGQLAENTADARKSMKPLLQIKRAGEDINGLSILALLYPSPTLAALGDTREIAAARPPDDPLPTQKAVLQAVRKRVQEALQPIVDASPSGGKEDERWYWVAPMILDHRAGHLKDWFEARTLASDVWHGRGDSAESEETGDQSALADGIAYALDLALSPEEDDGDGGPRALGKIPDDLYEVLAEIAVGSPGNVALRAITRTSNNSAMQRNGEVRNGAARVAWSFRSLFNQPEVTALIRGLDGNGPYWRQTLRYCISGGLQPVLDEYAHVLRDSLGILDGETSTDLESIAEEMDMAISLRAVGYRAREIDGTGIVDANRRVRSRFATRFGSDRSDDEKELRRAGAVRGAFNSPFWPFVLATTSIGQEGLDFHWYCHAIVHWNLPTNPVDLEQREGRIHRYKGHAVRKNLARKYQHTALNSNGDPWAAAFEAAEMDRSDSENDLVPYWLFSIEGGSTIDRYVPALPLSREISRYETLKRSLALYRLVFGQPRQEDLVNYLMSKGLTKEATENLVSELRIDLAPPPSTTS